MLRKWRGDVVCLQETKIENVSKELVRSVCWVVGGGGPYVDWPSLGAVESAGGILIMCDKGMVDC